MSEEKKPDLSNFPRGAISIKGTPVNRNARLPSIRIPRDLTLGAQPKRTFTPNIPVRRDKRPTAQKSDLSVSPKHEKASPAPVKSERGRGRGRARELIQTGGGIFEQGTAVVTKDRKLEPSYSKVKSSPSKKIKTSLKMGSTSEELDTLLRDDFLDDGSDEEDEKTTRPVMFPIPMKTETDIEKNVKEEKKESEDFKDENFAQNLGFDVQKISKFIKKEKTDAGVATKPTQEVLSKLPKNDITDILKNDEQIFLMKLPNVFTTNRQDPPSTAENLTNKESVSSISALPEGQLGKLQVLKSGKVRLAVGNVHFHLDYVKKLSTKHEIASVNLETCDLSVLANVEHLVNVSPDIIGSLTSMKLYE